MAALQRGDLNSHNKLLAEATRGIDADVLMLGQFSMVPARDAVRAMASFSVLTSPDSAVSRIRKLIERG
jgi:hypothetical protein